MKHLCFLMYLTAETLLLLLYKTTFAIQNSCICVRHIQSAKGQKVCRIFAYLRLYLAGINWYILIFLLSGTKHGLLHLFYGCNT